MLGYIWLKVFPCWHIAATNINLLNIWAMLPLKQLPQIFSFFKQCWSHSLQVEATAATYFYYICVNALVRSLIRTFSRQQQKIRRAIALTAHYIYAFMSSERLLMVLVYLNKHSWNISYCYLVTALLRCGYALLCSSLARQNESKY